MSMLAALSCVISCASQRASVPLQSGAITTSSITRTLFPFETVHFYTGKENVVFRERQRLDQNILWFQQHPYEMIVLEGHCDERGSEAYNMDLSDRRARWVKTYLAQRGIDPEKLIIIPYGESRPLGRGHSAAAWAANRRVIFRQGRE